MGFNNPAMPWRDLERTLSDRRGANGRAPGSPSWNSGGDGPAWSRKRQPYEPSPDLDPDATAGATRPPDRVARPVVPYAELHCKSNFSFLAGASHPEQLAEEATRLGLEALALTDQNGFYGVVRFAEAARAVKLPTVFGAEVTLDMTRYQPGLPEPAGDHVVLVADGPRGYARLARALSLGQLAGEKSAPRFGLDALAEVAAGGSSSTGTRGQDAWWVLTGGRCGSVPAALVRHGPGAATRELQRLVGLFGRDRVLVELWDHGDPLDSARNDALAELAGRHDVACVASNDVQYATPKQRRLASALAAVAARRSLHEIDPWLAPAATAHLRSGAEQMRRFQRYPGAVEMAARIGAEAAFDLALVAPRLPPFDCPLGANGQTLTEMQYLRQLVDDGATRRYGKRPDAGEDLSLRARAWRTIDHELDVIEGLGFPGYFLVVWDIVRFCREADILCQGRGSAANSAVCYALGITNADAVSLGLLFERFLSPERDGPPDIDIDIESDRREEVIQYVFAKHGRHHTAQVANVITYRAKSAVRDMAKALGYEPGQQDAFSKRFDGWGTVASTAAEPDHGIPATVLELAAEVEDAPRHLGIHSGGMVICDRPVIEVCPVEWARMVDRSVLQWDKDDCAAVGLVKFDLLGLGMLSALHGAIDLVRAHQGYVIDLAALEQDDQVYAMLRRADTVGVFQIESRAQMATLPRLKPRTFYDLVVEIALIRPGPIQGGSVHPYIRRRNGEEPVTYLHPLLENSLGKTLGVPLFQEQLMQMAIDVAGFSPSEADQLRQAMGSKRSRQRMERLRERLFAGMAERGITGEIAEELFVKMSAFANYGFPESHSVSFAYLVYASSWIKLYEPAAFCAALINAQPMGFWSPHTLVQDARRHGVHTRSPDLNDSLAQATLQPDADSFTGQAVRLGLSSVRGIGTALAEAIVAERETGGPFASIEDLTRRVPAVDLSHLETCATAGVFGECFGIDRRSALWSVGAVAQSRADRLAGIVTGAVAPRLPGMDPVEEAVADLWATGIAPTGHPTQFLRDELTLLGVTTSEGLWALEPDSKVVVAGLVTHRQRPMTAQGTTFMNLEDETGLINVVVSKGCWARFRRVAREAPALVVRGTLERAGMSTGRCVDAADSRGVINIVAEHLAPLSLPSNAVTSSRDFR